MHIPQITSDRHTYCNMPYCSPSENPGRLGAEQNPIPSHKERASLLVTRFRLLFFLLRWIPMHLHRHEAPGLFLTVYFAHI
jgi:hypothetical protein